MKACPAIKTVIHRAKEDFRINRKPGKDPKTETLRLSWYEFFCVSQRIKEIIISGNHMDNEICQLEVDFAIGTAKAEERAAKTYIIVV